MAEEKFCINCGEKLIPGEKFCRNCGAKIDDTPATPVQETSGPTEAGKPTVGTPPTQEEKNKLILFMVLSIIIPIVGIVFGIIFYNKKDKKSGMHYLLCGLSGILLGTCSATIPYVGWLVGLLVVASVAYNGYKQINAGYISADL